VKTLADCSFTTYLGREGRFVGVCREFPKLRSKAQRSRLDAIDDIISLVSQRIREIDEQRANGGAS